MLRSINKLKGLKVQTNDGEIGNVDFLFFDDEAWAVRYLVVHTGNWLTGRQVLVSPYSIDRLDGVAGAIQLSLTKEQVERSPEVDVLRPISRQQEAAFLNYYDYPYYWGSAEPMNLSQSPDLVRQEGRAVSTAAGGTAQVSAETPTDSHLRSTQTVSGYHIAAQDGDIGHVEDFILDDEIWVIRYLVIATRNWWPGKKVIVAPEWISSVDWRDSKVHVNLSREAIKGSPEFSEATLISREYENQLYRYYGRPGYWQEPEP